MDISSFDIPGMTESHRGLVDYCFNVAFADGCAPSEIDDAHLAALLRLRVRIISNFGLYVLANPDVRISAEALQDTIDPLISDALSRVSRFREMSEDRALLIETLSECRAIGWDSEVVREEIARFVSDAARVRCVDGHTGLAVLQAAGTDAISGSDRAFALSILGGWLSSMTHDGSWPGVTLTEALERCRMLAEVAIPGFVVRAEQIDRCYLRYVMKENPADLHTELLRIKARCSHYTDIEVDYADADIAFLAGALQSAKDMPAGMRAEACCALYDVLIQLYALDLMEDIEYRHSPDPDSPGTEYPRA